MFIIFPFYSSFLLFAPVSLFVYNFSFSFIVYPLLKISADQILLYVNNFNLIHFHFHFSVSSIIYPLRLSFLFFIHHFSTSFITSSLRLSFFLFVSRLRSSFLLFAHNITHNVPLRSSYLLFAHHFSSSKNTADHVGRIFNTFSI